jgi:hypothetical protein
VEELDLPGMLLENYKVSFVQVGLFCVANTDRGTRDS